MPRQLTSNEHLGYVAALLPQIVPRGVSTEIDAYIHDP
jgi:hypothetical protein